MVLTEYDFIYILVECKTVYNFLYSKFFCENHFTAITTYYALHITNVKRVILLLFIHVNQISTIQFCWPKKKIKKFCWNMVPF